MSRRFASLSVYLSLVRVMRPLAGLYLSHMRCISTHAYFLQLPSLQDHGAILHCQEA